MSSKKKVIFLSGGGTGGHFFLSLALKEQLVKNKNLEFYIFTDKRCRKYIPKNEKNIYIINVKLNFSNLSHIIISIWSNLSAIFKIFFISLKTNPRLLVSFGGYTTIPNLIVALLCRTKIVLYEANAVLGMTNRIFIKFAKSLLITYEKVLKLNIKYQKKTHIVSPLIIKNKLYNNINNNVLDKSNTNKFTILILGGSQGAKIFSTLITDAIISLKKYKRTIKVFQQAKKEDIKTIELLYQQHGIQHQVQDFFYNISEIFAQANLAISRSGASTIAELTANNIPTIFIPLPTSKDHHQYYNVEELLTSKAAWRFTENSVSSQDVANQILELKLYPTKLKIAKMNLKEHYNKKKKHISSVIMKIIG